MCMHIYAHCVRMHAHITAEFVWVHTHKSHKNPTSFSSNIMVCLLLQVACVFSCSVHACAHVHAHEHNYSTQEIDSEIC